MTYAKALALVKHFPLIAVNHIEGHIHAVVSQNAIELPALALVVSGGHTHLFEVREGFTYRLLGNTATMPPVKRSTKSPYLSASAIPEVRWSIAWRLWKSARRSLYSRENERQRARFQL